MLTLTAATRILVAVEPVDGRLGYNGLYALASQKLGSDPRQGHVFVFTNRRRNRLKILFWDGSGLWCCGKRLERGTFGWPKGDGVSVTLRSEEYVALAQGAELTPRKGWYRA